MYVNTKSLLEALKIHKKVIDRRVTLPILANVCIDVADGKTVLTSTDLETNFRTETDADGAARFVTTANCSKFHDAVKNHKNPMIEIAAMENDRIKIGNGVLMTASADEFPKIPPFALDTATDGGKYEPANITVADFSRVAPAIGRDETRPYLNGVYVNSAVCATDGHRLHKISKKVCKNHAIIPSKAVNILMSIKPVSFAMFVGENASRAVVTLKSGLTAYFGIRNIDGNFPDFSSVIPNEANRTRVLTANRDAITGALIGAQDYAECLGRGVKIGYVCDGDTETTDLEISTKNPNLGDYAVSGGIGAWSVPMEIGFNAKYLLDTLAVVRADTVKIEMCDEHDPCVICDDDLTAVIMPMRL